MYGKVLSYHDPKTNKWGFEHVKPFHHFASKSLQMHNCYMSVACIISNIDSLRIINYKARDPATNIITEARFAQLVDCIGSDNAIRGDS